MPSNCLSNPNRRLSQAHSEQPGVPASLPPGLSVCLSSGCIMQPRVSTIAAPLNLKGFVCKNLLLAHRKSIEHPGSSAQFSLCHLSRLSVWLGRMGLDGAHGATISLDPREAPVHPQSHKISHETSSLGCCPPCPLSCMQVSENRLSSTSFLSPMIRCSLHTSYLHFLLPVLARSRCRPGQR